MDHMDEEAMPQRSMPGMRMPPSRSVSPSEGRAGRAE